MTKTTISGKEAFVFEPSKYAPSLKVVYENDSFTVIDNGSDELIIKRKTNTTDILELRITPKGFTQMSVTYRGRMYPFAEAGLPALIFHPY